MALVMPPSPPTSEYRGLYAAASIGGLNAPSLYFIAPELQKALDSRKKFPLETRSPLNQVFFWCVFVTFEFYIPIWSFDIAMEIILFDRQIIELNRQFSCKPCCIMLDYQKVIAVDR